MSRLEFTLLASQDLDEIHDYIAERSPQRALHFIDRLQKRCFSLADTPGQGRRRDELAAGLRSVAEGNYVIFYRRIEEGVMIMRVLHGARDIQSLFANAESEEAE